jgi:hypothetical protein
MFLSLFAKTLLFFLSLVAAGLAQTVSVQVETKDVAPATASYLRIFCTNDVPLSGLRIPLKVGLNNDIIIDSVSFQYTIATGNFRLDAQVTDSDREGFINVIPRVASPIPTFPSGWGEICRIHFHTTMFATDAYALVDTFYHEIQIGNQTLYEQLEATDALGLGIIYPSFTAGGIRIRQATPVEDAAAETPNQFFLGQNFPNPFNPSTQIVFSLKQPDNIRLDVYDVAGHCLTTLAEGRFPSGEHIVIWDARSQPSGVYFYRLKTNSGVLTRKMLLIK